MNLDEIMRRIGDENISIQLLDQCVLGATLKKKAGYTEVRFGTDGMQPGDLIDRNNAERIGFIVWLNRAKTKAIKEAGPLNFSDLLKRVREMSKDRAETAEGMNPVEAYEPDDPAAVQAGLESDSKFLQEIADALVALGVK